jgi:aminoglycoside phosphotransferase family enzyme
MCAETERVDHSLLSALQEPGFHQGNPGKVSHRETHTSHLFFAGDLVYRIKKPGRFFSVDCSTPEKRISVLAEEFLLNQTLAPSIYLGVLPLVQEDGRWRFGDFAEPSEYALVMRRLPERRMLSYLLECNQVNSRMMQALAQILAPFHAHAKRGRELAPQSYPATIRDTWASNLKQIRPFVGPLLDGECFAVLQEFASAFITDHADSLARRVAGGRIREVHGDLRCDHICYAPEGIQIFGSAKPVTHLRYQDIAWDIASIILDLELRGETLYAMEFFKTYLELSADQELPFLLPFYKSYCALLRGKQEWFLTDGSSTEAPRYFDYACSTARQTPKEYPTLRELR